MIKSRTQLLQLEFNTQPEQTAARLAAMADDAAQPGEYVHALTFVPTSNIFSRMLVVVYHREE